MRPFPGKLESHVPHHRNREATILLRGLLDVAEARGVLGELDLGVELVDNGIIHPPATELSGVGEVHAYHLMPPGVTKAGAVACDLARRGLNRDRAAAIGDAVTDVAMAESVGVGVVVANALTNTLIAAAAAARPNVYATSLERGDGWAEFAGLWLAARG